MLTSRTLINFRKHQIALSLRINKVWSQTLVRLIAHSRGMGVLKTMVKDSLSGILVGVVSLFSHHILFESKKNPFQPYSSNPKAQFSVCVFTIYCAFFSFFFLGQCLTY